MAYVLKVKNPRHTYQLAKLLQDLYSRKGVKAKVFHSNKKIVVTINESDPGPVLYDSLNNIVLPFKRRGFECEVLDSSGEVEKKGEFIRKHTLDMYDVTILDYLRRRRSIGYQGYLNMIHSEVISEIGWLQGGEEELRNRLEKLCFANLVEHHENEEEHWSITDRGLDFIKFD